jgi:phenylpyruvate tautomerase PptA (4-oxalocrotonate tautomerase family)
MPYLQIEVNKEYPVSTKKLLAKHMGEAYAKIMQTNAGRITVSIKTLGEGSIWRCSESEPTPGAILMCDVRAGRSKEVRAELSRSLIEICNEILELGTNELNIEFTQHSGDEMYHQILGDFSEDWSSQE